MEEIKNGRGGESACFLWFIYSVDNLVIHSTCIMPEPVVMLAERAATQGDLDRLEECADRNLTKVNKDKRKVLHLGRMSPLQRCRLGLDWRERLC